IVFVVNLVNKQGQTPNFKVSDYVDEIKRYIGEDIFDYVIVNNSVPPPQLVEFYAKEGSLVENDLDDERIITADLLSTELKDAKGELMKKNLIRHDSKKLAKELMKIVDNI
ncbi:MAG: 2-phospho-L-lactate transferase CofD family protein, partial [Candidatus Woesearchaeota archaeon]